MRLVGGRADGCIVEANPPPATAVNVTIVRGEPRTPAQVALMWRGFKRWEFYGWDFGLPDRDGHRVYRCETPIHHPPVGTQPRPA